MCGTLKDDAVLEIAKEIARSAEELALKWPKDSSESDAFLLRIKEWAIHVRSFRATSSWGAKRTQKGFV